MLASNISTLDPTGARTRLFSRSNPDSPKVGDVLLVMFKSGESFTGVCLNIRRRGVDTGILLRNTLLTTGVEMWVKIYSPLVKMIEVVQRAQKRARRARLYYMRFVDSFTSRVPSLSPSVAQLNFPRIENADNIIQQETQTRSR